MLSVFIFSYNRGLYLRNCLESVQLCAPGCDVTVLDDDSTDLQTREILASLPSGVRVRQPNRRSGERHGGLYANMQTALDRAPSNRPALFIQDDMMLVRPVRQEDLQYVDAFFKHFPRAAFLNPVFLKGKRKRRDYRVTRLHPDFPVYFRHYPSKKNSRGLTYADAVLADPDRLRAARWRFLPGEIANAEQAREQFGDMGFMAYPFMMFLPRVTVYRGGRKTVGVRLAERRAGTDPKPYLPMPEDRLRELFQRDLSVLPHAERFLTCADPAVPRPFVYSAVNAFLIPYCLHKMELFLRRNLT